MNTFIKLALFAFIAIQAATANKVVAYWGQNSVGSPKEGSLRDYCSSPSIDIIVIGFVHQFPTAPGSSYPGLNFANHCWRTFSSSSPNFLNCSDAIGPDVTYCQSLGKQIILSFGGAVGNYGFSSDAQAQTFADTVWNMFLGGSSALRPFGPAVFDGVDLDIESGGSRGYAAFITQLRTHFTAQSRTYLITGAPQCVYPDAMLGPGKGTALGEAWFDYVWVQFYNNYCGINYYPGQFNFNVWAAWAKSSKNPNVQVLVGAPSSQASAGQGYVTADTLKIIHTAVSATFPSNYGGIMLWDIGTAKKNSDFATQLASFVKSSGNSPVINTPTPAPTPVPTPAPVPAPVQSSSTSGSTSTSTSGSTSTSTTGRAKPAPAPVTPTQSSGSSNSCSTDGYMKCAGTDAYQTCSRGSWAAPQFCKSGLKCSPSGNYIYCVR